MVAQLVSWYEQNHAALQARGLAVSLDQSPADGRDKPSAWVRVLGVDAEAEMIVWDSGECELWGPVRTPSMPGTDPQAEHLQLDTDAEFAAAIDRMLSIFEA